MPPHKKKKGKGHGTTKTLIMAALLTCKGQRARVEWTTYDFPHCLVPAKEEAKRAFMAIVMEAEEGMQKGKAWQAGLKVYKEERAGKGSSHEAPSRPAGREPAGQPLAVQQAAPARFSCQTAWASRTPPDIAAWYFSPGAPDIYSHFQSGWARKDPQDSIDWIFRMVAPRRRTRHRRTRQQAQTFTLRRWPPRWSHRQGGLHRWHSSGGKEDDRPDEEGQPAISIDIIGQARPEFQARNTSTDS